MLPIPLITLRGNGRNARNAQLSRQRNTIKSTVKNRYYRLRSQSHRIRRLLFPSPAEVKFLQVMGGYVLVFPFLRSIRNSFPLTIVLSMGCLKRELVYREVRCGRYWVDFCAVTPFYRRVIEIDGQRFHDILKDQERDDYLHERGYAIMRIPARRLWREPKRVRSDVLKFLRS